MEPKTTISVSKIIRDQLASLGTKDSTFNEIIRTLLQQRNN